jgi:hypothetical protein
MQQNLTVTGNNDLAGGEAQAGAVPVLNSHTMFRRGCNSPVECFSLSFGTSPKCTFPAGIILDKKTFVIYHMRDLT